MDRAKQDTVQEPLPGSENLTGSPTHKDHHHWWSNIFHAIIPRHHQHSNDSSHDTTPTDTPSPDLGQQQECSEPSAESNVHQRKKTIAELRREFFQS